MNSKKDDSDSARDTGKSAIPLSAKKKKTYRVVESRYLNFAKSEPHSNPSASIRKGSPYKGSKSQEAPRGEDSFGSTTMHTTCSGAKISTPQKDGLERPRLDCNEISAIHATLKETGNQTLQPMRHTVTTVKNPTIKKPLLNSNAFARKIKGNLFDNKIKENVPFTQPGRTKNKNQWDTSSACDLEVLYSQYLMSNFMALHAEKCLEIQDKDQLRILYSLAEANKSLADQCLELENQVHELQINTELEEAADKQMEVLQCLDEYMPLCVMIVTEIRNFFEISHNQMFLNNIKVTDDASELENKASIINSQMEKILEASSNIQPLIDKLNSVTQDILKGKTSHVGNELKISKNCQKLLSLASYQVSLFLQAKDAARRNPPMSEVDDLILNW